MKRVIFPLLLALMLAGAAIAQTPSMTTNDPMLWSQTISVTGNGMTQVTPDRVTFNVGVQTVSPTVDAAVNENNARVAAVVAALKKAGATDKEIRTSNFFINPQQEYNNQGQLPRIIGYQVSNSVTVTRTDIASAGRLLQAAISAGVNQASGLSFEVSDPKRGREEGLQAAFADARAKASVLAQAAGRPLGRALSISEGARPDIPRPMPMAKGMVAQEAVSEVPVESGTQQVNYTVSVVFELR
ncbi:MAG: SIMPL domain-containing protein [Thermoanaerobaculia bacterium]